MLRGKTWAPDYLLFLDLICLNCVFGTAQAGHHCQDGPQQVIRNGGDDGWGSVCFDDLEGMGNPEAHATRAVPKEADFCEGCGQESHTETNWHEVLSFLVRVPPTAWEWWEPDRT